VLSAYIKGISTQTSFDQSEAGVLQQGEDGRQGHHQAVQLPKVTGWKPEKQENILAARIFSHLAPTNSTACESI